MSQTSDQIEAVDFDPGEILFLEGESSFHFFIIQSGEVEIYKSMATGKKVPLAVCGEGTAIGEFAMIDRRPRSATARALTQVSAVRVSEESYQKLLSDLPDWAVSVMRALVERLRHNGEVLRQAGVVDARIQAQIDSAEYDSDAGTFVEETPFLRAAASPDDDPEMP